MYTYGAQIEVCSEIHQRRKKDDKKKNKTDFKGDDDMRGFCCITRINLLLFVILYRRCNAFSTYRSSSNRCHSSSGLQAWRSRTKKNDPPAGGVQGYVPDGLTAQEYANIKKKEQMKQSKMNFAQWGPKFRPTGAPAGANIVIKSVLFF